MQLAVSLPLLGDSPDESRRPVRHPLLDEIKHPAGDAGQQRIGGDESVELVSMQDQEPDAMIVVDVLVLDIDADHVADDVDRPVVVAAHPDQPEIRPIRVAANHLQTREMPFCQPLEVQVVEDVAVDHELIAVLDGPDQKLLEQLRLADVAAQVQVADDQAVVVQRSADRS